MANPLAYSAGSTPWQADWRPRAVTDASGDGGRRDGQVFALPAGPAMVDQWPLLSHLEFGALPGAVACARLHTRQVLWEWGLSAIAENAELLVSELVTNATQASPYGQGIQPVGLWLSSDRCRLLILVQDTSQNLPAPASEADPNDEGGRGLLIVDSISALWGWDTSQDSSGKVVWALLE